MNLAKGEKGHKYEILEINGSQELLSKLNSHGVIKGRIVTIIRVSLFGDPIQINCWDNNLIIRKNDAKNIFVKELN